MSVSVDSGDGKSVDVQLNIVPYIDMMSCLTAFLLITAVWSNVAQLEITPKGVGRDAEQALLEEPPINISLLLAQDSVWVGLTTGDRRQIAKMGDDYDFAQLQEVLTEYKDASGIFKDRSDIEIAAEDGVLYQSIIDAIDSSVSSGFKDVGFVDPSSLSVRFKQ